MLTTSVAVVRKMLDAVAGSAPKRLSVSGTSAPATPLMTQLQIIAAIVIAATRRRALELFPDKEETYEVILAPRFARLLDEFTAG